jgi:hypothetical protein
MVIVEKLVEWRLAGETEVLGEYLPQCHFVHRKSHMTRPGFENQNVSPKLFYQTEGYHIPEDGSLHSHRRNLFLFVILFSDLVIEDKVVSLLQEHWRGRSFIKFKLWARKY